jgi:hypothetical protein
MATTRTFKPYTKVEILKSLQKIPEDATVADAIEWLHVLRDIEVANAQILAGDTFTQADIEQEMAEWQD